MQRVDNLGLVKRCNKSFYLTDAGKVRSHNEDSVTIINNKNNEYLLAVADGMGGHKAGEVASSIAINHLTESFYRLDTLGDKDTAIDWLRNVVTEINKQIFEYTDNNPDSKKASRFSKDVFSMLLFYILTWLQLLLVYT